MQYKISTLKQMPEMKEQIDLLSEEAWPEFLLNSGVQDWKALFDIFTDYQILFIGDKSELIALGHTVPLFWKETPDDLPPDIYKILSRAIADSENGGHANAVSALAAIVKQEYLGQGLSRKIVEAMKSLGKENGLKHLIAPVRPTIKQHYPLIPFEEYVNWKNVDGLPYDPWMRVHARMGAKTMGIIPDSLIVKSSVSDWELWTGLKFPGSGRYIVPGGLEPISIDHKNDQGIYHDPNIWMCHTIK